MKKILLYIMVVVGMASLQSCLHDDKDLFSESAADRLEHAAEETKQILESSESGWALQYYLGEQYTGSGLTYLCKFKNGKADVTVDLLGDPSNISHSSYDVIKDQGPVLTFNTFNEWMHYFANPNSDGTTNGGDFEFAIMKVSQDTIDLKGRTTGNKMRLIRLPEGTSWESYLNAIGDFEENMFGSYRVMADGAEQGIITFDSDNRQFSYVDANKQAVTYPYCPTPNGVAMPVSLVDDASNFVLQSDGFNMAASDASEGKSVILEPFFTPDYVLSNVGSVSLNDNAQTKQVKLKLASKYTYSTDADWLTVSADDNGLTFKVTANEAGHPRVATVKVANENGEDEFTVTQLEYDKDIVGTYVMQYYDADNAVAQTSFEVTKGSENAIDVPIAVGNYTLHATFTWNAETASFDWSSFQYLGQWSSYYIYNVFVGSQYWSATSENFTWSAPVSYDDENGTYAFFSEGSVNGEEISYANLQACDAKPATSSNFKGYIELIQSPVLVKIPENGTSSAAKAKGRKTTKVLAKKNPSIYLNPQFSKKLMK